MHQIRLQKHCTHGYYGSFFTVIVGMIVVEVPSNMVMSVSSWSFRSTVVGAGVIVIGVRLTMVVAVLFWVTWSRGDVADDSKILSSLRSDSLQLHLQLLGFF